MMIMMMMMMMMVVGGTSVPSYYRACAVISRKSLFRYRTYFVIRDDISSYNNGVASMPPETEGRKRGASTRRCDTLLPKLRGPSRVAAAPAAAAMIDRRSAASLR
eukprot:GHVU01149797.1.p2 GENE.GHVU01149797.1~~GHVU01149797.1.p2  ORF type:complete len:105 (-),score=10.19 GHVU01149797.1:646-960(-)